MKETKVTCDIQDCGKIADKKDFALQVIFTTDQTEGRSCNPIWQMRK